MVLRKQQKKAPPISPAGRTALAMGVAVKALREYADPANWDGAGGWTNPKYSTEFAEVALRAIELAMPKQFKGCGVFKKRPKNVVSIEHARVLVMCAACGKDFWTIANGKLDRSSRCAECAACE